MSEDDRRHEDRRNCDTHLSNTNTLNNSAIAIAGLQEQSRTQQRIVTVWLPVACLLIGALFSLAAYHISSTQSLILLDIRELRTTLNNKIANDAGYHKQVDVNTDVLNKLTNEFYSNGMKP
jgi:hypothetical protein